MSRHHSDRAHLFGSFRHTIDRALAAATAILVISTTSLDGFGQSPVPDPWPREVIDETTVLTWEFADSDAPEITAEKMATVTRIDGAVRISSSGADPIVWLPPMVTARTPADVVTDSNGAVLPRIIVKMSLRSSAPGPAQLFWIGRPGDGASEPASIKFSVRNDGDWHDYAIALPADVAIHRLRFDPATGIGAIDVRSIEIVRTQLHPVNILRVVDDGDSLHVHVRNDGIAPIRFPWEGDSVALSAGQEKVLSLASSADPADRVPRFQQVGFVIDEPTFGRLARSWIRYRPGGTEPSIELREGARSVRVSVTGLGAEITHDDRVVAVIAPLAWDRRRIGEWNVVATANGIECRSHAFGTTTFRFQSGDLQISRHEPRRSVDPVGRIEGPVLRVRGPLEQALFPGVEHLGHDERSSSNLDIRGPEHLRYEPDPLLVTQPMAAWVTDSASVAVAWDDPRLQPVFATPNFYEGTSEHRWSVIGPRVDVAVTTRGGFSSGSRVEDLVLWHLDRTGLPAPPAHPRSWDDQRQMVLETLSGPPLADDTATRWYHAFIPEGKTIPAQPQRFTDFLSLLWRLTGELPDHANWSVGGSHLSDDSIYFATGRASDWLAHQRRVVGDLIDRQDADGGYRYRGPYREGHFEDTASGQNGRPAMLLLEFAARTGDPRALEAGLKTLEFCRRFRTPRGASVWECPLHAPDLLASAHLCRAYTLAFQLTGNPTYKDLAVRWAVSGMPYVYLWSDRPIMSYATIGTLCATHYQAPVWIGRPVQWMGLVYADALLDLHEIDSRLPWREIARGILAAGELQQYSEGPSRGCLADSLMLASQQLLPFDINPCALMKLRLRLREEPVGLYWGHDATHHAVSPFPISVDGERATITARKGVTYQVIVDGQQVIDIDSNGVDQIRLSR